MPHRRGSGGASRLDFARAVGYERAVCPKCGSGAYEPGQTCPCCAYEAGGRLTWPPEIEDPGPGGDNSTRASERRLDEAFAELDQVLYGEETEDPMSDEKKIYQCQQCPRTFLSSQALAGHVNTHRRHGPVRSVSVPGSPIPRPARPANGRDLMCPMCSQPLPAAVRVVAEDFAREGVDEELAAKLAAKAYGLLRAPA